MLTASRNSTLKGLSIAWVLVLGVSAQRPPPVMRGTWTAMMATKQVYRGQWTGQMLPEQPNAVQGSWLVLNDANAIVLQGTWAADKTKRGWRGQWSARIAGSQPSGTVLSGTWQIADNSTVASLAGLLQRTVQQQVAGSWRSGRLAGNWWATGLSQ